MEYLTFNKSGQWELHKSTNANDGTDKEPKSDYKNGKQYQVFRGNTVTGELHEDRGQKGTLHDYGGGVRPKQINWANVGRVGKPVESVYNERNPGVGN